MTLRKCINIEEIINKKELKNTRSCKDCFYNIKNSCCVDRHSIEYDIYRAYSCKYYKNNWRGDYMKYKVGDIVKIKDSLQAGEKYGICRVIESMLKFRGTIDTIEYIDTVGDFYLSDEDNSYVWHKDMLEPATIEDDLEQSTTPNISRLTIYQHLLNNLEETYEAKNNDYGNSVADTYEKFGPVSFLVRITDKYNRLMTLCNPNAPEQKVKDEKIDDTILDLANYCLLWLVEKEYKNQ